MSSRDRSRERSPPEQGITPKKTKEGGSDEDAPMPPAEEPNVPPTLEKAGGSARRGPTSARTPTKKGKHHASPKSSSKGRGKSSLAQIGFRVRSLFGMGGSSTSSPSKRGEPSSTQSSQSGSSKGRKPFIGPLLPEGYIPYSRSELDRIAEYYRQTSFLNRGVGITEYIPWGPGAEVTIPWTTPPPRSGTDLLDSAVRVCVLLVGVALQGGDHDPCNAGAVDVSSDAPVLPGPGARCDVPGALLPRQVVLQVWQDYGAAVPQPDRRRAVSGQGGFSNEGEPRVTRAVCPSGDHGCDQPARLLRGGRVVAAPHSQTRSSYSPTVKSLLVRACRGPCFATTVRPRRLTSRPTLHRGSSSRPSDLRSRRLPPMRLRRSA
ncbi:hypothetical protein MTO96_010983 [Rhipicephalus appendiculatus]